MGYSCSVFSWYLIIPLIMLCMSGSFVDGSPVSMSMSFSRVSSNIVSGLKYSDTFFPFSVGFSLFVSSAMCVA